MYIHLFPYVTLTADGRVFIDIYIWDYLSYPDTYKRCVIREGYRMTEADEQSYLHYIQEAHDKKVVVDEERMDYLFQKSEVFCKGN